jgi:hypothetical protein
VIGHDAWYAVWLVACGFGLAAIAALIVLYRRAAARRELEVAERLLEEAYADDPH